jgi:acyl-CoA synthetase (AMP-forming)/AMP-acid ligase II
MFEPPVLVTTAPELAVVIVVSAIEKVVTDIVKSPVAVIAKKNAEGLNFLVGFIEGESMPEEQLKAEMLKFLPDYMIPSKILNIEKIPLNGNQKVDRKELGLINY